MSRDEAPDDTPDSGTPRASYVRVADEEIATLEANRGQLMTPTPAVFVKGERVHREVFVVVRGAAPPCRARQPA